MSAFFRMAEPPEQMKDWAIGLVRFVVGLTFLLHGWQKLFQFGMAGVTGAFGQMGAPIPEVTGPLVSILEFAGGAALAVGLLTRLIAIPLAIDMLAAMFIVTLKNGFFVSEGGAELELLLFVGALAMAVGGPGALSVDRAISSVRSRSAYVDSRL